MNTSQKISKKNVRKSRRTPEIKMDDNYSYMVEKQLEDDFKVHQYLHQHPNEGHDMEQYVALINSMLVKKKSKSNMKQYLYRITMQSLQKQQNNNLCNQRNRYNFSEFSPSTKRNDSYYSEEQFIKIKQQLDMKQQLIEQKTQQEEQMSRILLKEIIEKKKTLNLLKGDIAHMITRNQSISVLQSKVNKVSLVSQNQLKRVSIALSKDKQQVQLRQQMQRKFHNKLKIVQGLQNKNLKKVKSNYIDTMNRKKIIFDRLTQIQKQCASVEEYSDQLKQKQQKNSRSIAAFNLLSFAYTSIDKVSQLQMKDKINKQNVTSYSQALRNIFYEYQSVQRVSTTIDDIIQEKLKNFVVKILQEYKKLESQIHERKKQYSFLIDEIEQKWRKILGHVNNKKQLNQQLNAEERNQLQYSEQQIMKYFQQVKLLQRNYAVLYKLLDFFNRKIPNFSGFKLVTIIYSNSCFHLKINKQNDINLKTDVFDEVKSNIGHWFYMLKKWMEQYRFQCQKKNYELMNKIKNQKQSQQNENVQTYDKQSKIDKTQPSEYLSQIQFEVSNKQIQEDYAQQNKSQINDDTKKHCFEGVNKMQVCIKQEQAKRIQLLDKIDQTYYNMIKQTIQMEKQNTKKNYEFQQTFKRNKYSTQDQLLEEKRFEASFSNLFKQDSDDYLSKHKTKSKVWNNEKLIGKKNTLNREPLVSLHSSIKNKEASFTKYLGSESYRKNTTFWQKQKKIKLSKKLQQILGNEQ